MKKIIFVINNLETGGVQISLLNLIKEIHNDYDVTVLCFSCKDEYRTLFPENVKLIGTDSPFKYFGVSQGELHGHPSQFLARSFWAVLIKCFGRSFATSIMSSFQRTVGEFDCAISYLHESPQKRVYGGCNDFVLNNVKAQKKVAWLHCDFEQCGANNASSQKIYRQFDSIVACSEGCRQSFLRCLPDLEQKTVTIRNCNDYERIRRLAEDAAPREEKFFHIVTVARLAEEKGIDRAIRSVKVCMDRGYRIRYDLIGSGDQEAKLKQLVAELSLEDTVCFLGNQTNPYRYMVAADLFLLPSYHEAAPMVFDEAACLGVPVLTTETTSTDEMIRQNNSGIVCENSQEGLTTALLKILNDQNQLMDIKKNLANRLFDNAESVSHFNRIVDL